MNEIFSQETQKLIKKDLSFFINNDIKKSIVGELLGALLIEKKYDIFEFLRDRYKAEHFNIYAPLNIALQENNQSKIDYILSIKYECSEFINECLLNAIFNQYNDAIIFILKDKRTNKEELFANACKNDNITIAKYIYNNFDIDPIFHKNKSFTWAAQARNYEIMDYLIYELLVDPSLNQCRSFYSACFNNDFKLKKYLFQFKNVQSLVQDKLPEEYKKLEKYIVRDKIDKF